MSEKNVATLYKVTNFYQEFFWISSCFTPINFSCIPKKDEYNLYKLKISGGRGWFLGRQIGGSLRLWAMRTGFARFLCGHPAMWTMESFGKYFCVILLPMAHSAHIFTSKPEFLRKSRIFFSVIFRLIKVIFDEKNRYLTN